MKKIISFILFSFAAASCTKESDTIRTKPTEDQCLVSLRFSFVVQGGSGTEIIPFSRADIGQAAENALCDVWVFQFATDTPTDETLLVGTPQYAVIDSEEVSLSLKESEGGNHTLLFAANLGSDFVWDLPTVAPDYADVMSVFQTISDENDLTSGGLSFSGSYTGLVAEGTAIAADLYRNAAKVELRLKPASAYEIQSVQLCNVAQSLFPFEGLAAGTTGTAEVVPTISYQSVAYADGADIAGGKSFVFYAPANLQGVSDNNVESKKNESAPQSATYFRIVVRSTATTDEFSYFLTIYPGADETKDFNIASNTHYTYTLEVNDLANFETDSRVETDAPVTLEIANSYIINPLSVDFAYERRSIEIPVRRVNDFWGSSAYGDTPANVIGAEDEWTAELLWQDKPGIVGKQSGKITLGRNAAETAAGKSSGTGPDKGFVINIPKNLQAADYGNFSVAVKKSGNDKILWSWHFWVTDYAPQLPASIDGEIQQYTVSGGEVHRYRGTAWGYTGGTYSDAVSTSAPYARSVIMDRSLGAIDLMYGADFGHGKLYYQFGRKDPKPGSIDLYDIDGTALPTSVWNKTTVNRIDQAVGIATGVNNPLTYYAGGTTEENNADWCTDGQLVGYLWNDPNVADGDVLTGKSIHDPCPPGWRVPVNGVFADFAASTVAFNTTNKEAVYRSFAKFYLVGYMRHTVGAQTLSFNGARQYVRTATVNTTYNTRSHMMQLNSSPLVSGGASGSRAGGYSVRCVSQ